MHCQPGATDLKIPYRTQGCSGSTEVKWQVHLLLPVIITIIVVNCIVGDGDADPKCTWGFLEICSVE